MFTHSRTDGDVNQGVEMSDFLLTPSESLAKSLLPVPITLSSVAEGGMVLPGDTTMVLLKWKVGLPPGRSGLFMPVNQHTRKEGQLG